MTQKHSSDAKQVIVLKVADRLTRLIILLCKIKRTQHMHLVPEIYIFTITGYIATFFSIPDCFSFVLVNRKP